MLAKTYNFSIDQGASFYRKICIKDSNKNPMSLDGYTATQGKYSVQNNAVTPLVSAASTIPTTVGAVSVYEVELFCDEVWFHGKTMDSTTQRANSYVRQQQIPDPNALYKLQLRWVNGGVAPASSTNANLQFLACQDYAELTAEITSGRGQSVAGQGVGVYVTGGSLATQPISGSVTVSGTVTANWGTLTTPTNYNVNSLATTNFAVVKGSAGTLYNISIFNVSASTRYVKLYNKATIPLSTDIPIITIPIIASGSISLPFGTLGLRFGTGIGIGITANAVDNDNTAIGSAEVKVVAAYV